MRNYPYTLPGLECHSGNEHPILAEYLALVKKHEARVILAQIDVSNLVLNLLTPQVGDKVMVFKTGPYQITDIVVGSRHGTLSVDILGQRVKKDGTRGAHMPHHIGSRIDWSRKVD